MGLTQRTTDPERETAYRLQRALFFPPSRGRVKRAHQAARRQCQGNNSIGMDRMNDVRHMLRHVLWIGGPPDAGKTTVADLLGRAHGLPVYHFDRHEMDHIARADPARHPQLYALRVQLAELDEQAWLDEYWVRPSVQEMARSTITSWSERVELAVEDILALPADDPLIAEGPGFFPEGSSPCYRRPARRFSSCHRRRSSGRRTSGARSPGSVIRQAIPPVSCATTSSGTC